MTPIEGFKKYILILLDNRLYRFMLLVIVGLVGIGFSVPGALYFSPWWGGSVEDKITPLLEDQLMESTITLVAPSRLIPGESYELRVEVKNLSIQNQAAKLTLDTDSPYLDFPSSPDKPFAVLDDTIAPGQTDKEYVSLKMAKVKSAPQHVTLLFEFTSPEGTFQDSRKITVDLISVPLGWLIAGSGGLLVSIVVAVIPFTKRFIMGG